MVRIAIGTISFIEWRSTPGRLFVGAMVQEKLSVVSVSCQLGEEPSNDAIGLPLLQLGIGIVLVVVLVLDSLKCGICWVAPPWGLDNDNEDESD
jgi:hypothetical protein